MSDFNPPEPPVGGTPPPPPPGGVTPPPPPPGGVTPPPPPPGGVTPPPPPPGGVAPPPAPGGVTPPPNPGFSTAAPGSSFEPAPPAGQFAGAPGAAGFPPSQGYGAAGPMSQPAEWGTRAVAYIIDILMVLPIYLVAVIGGAILGNVSDALGAIVSVLGSLAALAFIIYNVIYLQGTTGQSVGKKQQGIRLQSDANGQPIGAGMALVRMIVAGVISTFTCGIGGLLDLLWPLWDKDKKRLTDKVLKNSVVVGGEKGGKLLPFL